MDNYVSKNTFYYKFFELDINGGCLAIKTLLKQHILKSIELYQDKIPINTEFSLIKSLIADKIALHCPRKISSLDIVYRCAIAFPLGNHWHLLPLKVAQSLREFLLTTDVISTTQPLLEFTVEIVPPGWIDFYLSDRALAVWLEELVGWISRDARDGEDEVDREEDEDNQLFVIQYAHARCCSLLRLGHQEKLIKIKYKYSVWEIVEPITFPWVDARDRLLLRHPAEKRLLIQLLMVVEELITNSQKINWTKLAHNLSAALLDFWTECRIYGEIKQKTPKLAQARLGLVALVQYFLYQILRDKLHVSPLTKL